MKKSVKTEWHAPRSPYGHGDYYGSAIKNPVGKPVRNYLTDVIPEKKLSKPPKSLA